MGRYESVSRYSRAGKIRSAHRSTGIVFSDDGRCILFRDEIEEVFAVVSLANVVTVYKVDDDTEYDQTGVY